MPFPKKTEKTESKKKEEVDGNPNDRFGCQKCGKAINKGSKLDRFPYCVDCVPKEQ